MFEGRRVSLGRAGAADPGRMICNARANDDAKFVDLVEVSRRFFGGGGRGGGRDDISGTGVVAGGRASEREDAGPPLLDDGIVAMDDSRTMKGGRRLIA